MQTVGADSLMLRTQLSCDEILTGEVLASFSFINLLVSQPRSDRSGVRLLQVLHGSKRTRQGERRQRLVPFFIRHQIGTLQ